MPRIAESARNRKVSHEHVFSSWTWQSDRLLSLAALREAIGKTPTSIYRTKSLLSFAEEPGDSPYSS
ncbi:GTP-binding protein [Bradyrhizobium genosp. A]|uniref:GTP-binding protein n=1 Tax=Bradyrhizobium genosp. A TaxID=83626 RepID=UPI003CE7C163